MNGWVDRHTWVKSTLQFKYVRRLFLEFTQFPRCLLFTHTALIDRRTNKNCRICNRIRNCLPRLQTFIYLCLCSNISFNSYASFYSLGMYSVLTCACSGESWSSGIQDIWRQIKNLLLLCLALLYQHAFHSCTLRFGRCCIGKFRT